MSKWVLIAVGGSAGALLRYVAAGYGQRLIDGTFPLGTLVVNVTGCLLIGVLGAVFAGPVIVREEVRFALLVGFLGSFTTFSTFGFETFALLEAGAWRDAAVNVLASNLLGLAAVWIGYRLGQLWQGT